MKKTVISLAVMCVVFSIIFSGCAKKNIITQEATPNLPAAGPAEEPQAKDSDGRVISESITPGDGTVIENSDQPAGEADNRQTLQSIYFEYDSWLLSGPMRDILFRNAQWLKNNARGIIVEGHTDEQGSSEYNIALGERRGNSVKNYLVNMGIEEARLTVISYGEEVPAVDGHDEAAWAKNRRVEFLLK